MPLLFLWLSVIGYQFSAVSNEPSVSISGHQNGNSCDQGVVSVATGRLLLQRRTYPRKIEIKENRMALINVHNSLDPRMDVC